MSPKRSDTFPAAADPFYIGSEEESTVPETFFRHPAAGSPADPFGMAGTVNGFGQSRPDPLNIPGRTVLNGDDRTDFSSGGADVKQAGTFRE